MGIHTYFRAATSDDLDHLVAHPKTLDWFLAHPAIPHTPPAYLEKSIPFIQRMFDAASLPVQLDWPPETVVSIDCGSPEPNYCHHYAWYPADVRHMHDAFSSMSTDEMAAQYQRAIGSFGGRRRDDDVQYAVGYYKDLKQFIAFVATDGLGALMNRG